MEMMGIREMRRMHRLLTEKMKKSGLSRDERLDLIYFYHELTNYDLKKAEKEEDRLLRIEHKKIEAAYAERRLIDERKAKTIDKMTKIRNQKLRELKKIEKEEDSYVVS